MIVDDRERHVVLVDEEQAAEHDVMPSAQTSGLIVGFGIGMPSSFADLPVACLDVHRPIRAACFGIVADGSGVRRGRRACAATSTSTRLSPRFVCGTSALSSGALTSHSG